MPERHDVVIVGAGEAGTAAALALRGRGFEGSILVIGAESGPAYHRPPLSKGFLLGTDDHDTIVMADADDLRSSAIDVRFGVRGTSIDRHDRILDTDAGQIGYRHLVLATGASNRPTETLDGVCQLRTREDAQQLRERLADESRIVVVGAGFLGLEVAAVASDLGLDVEVVEVAATPLGGRVSVATAQAVEHYLHASGIRFSFGTSVTGMRHRRGRLTGVELDDGRVLDTRLALVSIGVEPDTRLAGEAGLAVWQGVGVNEHLLTSDPAISAIGDCAEFPDAKGASWIRVESIANALGHADCLAARLCGDRRPYVGVPWFWSVHGQHRLELVGSSRGADHVVINGDPTEQDFAAYCFLGERLVGFESVNRPREHLRMRRLFERSMLPTPDVVAHTEFDLATWKPTPTGETVAVPHYRSEASA